jgi:hypothetical protein
MPSENSEHHWTHFNVKNLIVLDLGCGLFNLPVSFEQSSPIWIGNQGADKVIGIDGNPSEIDYFNSNNPDPKKYTFAHKMISSADDIRSLLSEYKPTAIKCDIEGHEMHFYDITKEDMKNVVELAIEYHTYEILERITQKIEEWGFEIHTEGKFTYCHVPHAGVLFCSKK